MYNWNTDTSELKKNKEKYAIWKLEQFINFGLNGQKLPTKLLKKYWDKLSIDPRRRRVLKSWIW